MHEIKHDGYRLMARRDPVSVGIRLLIRNGHNWASRYPLIVQAVNKLKSRGSRSAAIGEKRARSECRPARNEVAFERLPVVLALSFNFFEAPGVADTSGLHLGDGPLGVLPPDPARNDVLVVWPALGQPCA